MHRHLAVSHILLALVVAVCSQAIAAVPTTINMQGVLADSNGNPLPAALKIFTFRIFTAEAGGAQVWPNGGVGENQTLFTDSTGAWNACIGEVVPLDEGDFSYQPNRWLQITVSDGVNPAETLPRMQFKSHAYAFHAETAQNADQLDGYNHSDFAFASHNHTTNWTNLPFAAGIDDYVDVAGSTLQRCQYRKEGDRVHLRGVLIDANSTPITSGRKLATLPVGFRPPAQTLHYRLVSTIAAGGSAGRWISIETNGDIIVSGTDGLPWMSLEDVSFSTSP